MFENCVLEHDKNGKLEEVQLLVNNMMIDDSPSNVSKQDSHPVEHIIRKFEHQMHFKHAERKETLSVPQGWMKDKKVSPVRKLIEKFETENIAGSIDEKVSSTEERNINVIDRVTIQLEKVLCVSEEDEIMDDDECVQRVCNKTDESVQIKLMFQKIPIV